MQAQEKGIGGGVVFKNKKKIVDIVCKWILNWIKHKIIKSRYFVFDILELFFYQSYNGTVRGVAPWPLVVKGNFPVLERWRHLTMFTIYKY